MRTLIEKKQNLTDRIASLTHHAKNMREIGGEGRLMLASEFEEKVEKLKQRLFEVNLELDGL